MADINESIPSVLGNLDNQQPGHQQAKSIFIELPGGSIINIDMVDYIKRSSAYGKRLPDEYCIHTNTGVVYNISKPLFDKYIRPYMRIHIVPASKVIPT